MMESHVVGREKNRHGIKGSGGSSREESRSGAASCFISFIIVLFRDEDKSRRNLSPFGHIPIISVHPKIHAAFHQTTHTIIPVPPSLLQPILSGRSAEWRLLQKKAWEKSSY
jgi:hypothetical protein